MLYATKFWAPDPFILLERNGKRTLVLSDLEIDRGRKQAKADEIISFNQLEREVQGKSKKAPPYEKILAHFLRKRGVRSTIVPANFPLGYAQELAANKIRVQATNGLFWPEREAKSENEVEMIGRALRITEKGLNHAIEALGGGQGRASACIEKNQGGSGWNDDSQGNPRTLRQAQFSNRSAQGQERRFFSRHRSRTWSRDPRTSPPAKSDAKRPTSSDG